MLAWTEGNPHLARKNHPEAEAMSIGTANDLRAISRNGTGIDNIDLAFARERKIQILRAPAANSRGVAELAIALAFAALRRLPFLSESLKHVPAMVAHHYGMFAFNTIPEERIDRVAETSKNPCVFRAKLSMRYRLISQSDSAVNELIKQ